MNSETKKLSPKQKQTTLNKNMLDIFSNSWFRIVLLGFIAVVIALVFLVVNLNKHSISGKYYHSTGLGLSATFPKGWYIQDNSNNGSIVGLLYATDIPNALQANAKGHPTITISKAPVSGSLEQFSKAVFTANAKKTIIRAADTSVGGLPAKLEEMTSLDFGHEEDVAALSNTGVGYIFVIYAQDSNWAALQPAWQNLLNSVSFYN